MKKTIRRIAVLFLAAPLVGVLAFALLADCGKEARQLRASPDHSMFYSPDKPRGASLPVGAKAFLASVEKAFAAHDLDAVMRHFSDDFLHQGMTKRAFRDHLTKSFLVKHLDSMTVTLLEFGDQDDIADIAGFIETDLGAALQSSHILPISAGSKLRLENAQWKFLGNRKQSPVGAFHDSLAIYASLTPKDLKLYRALLPKVFGMPETPTVWVDVTEHQRVSSPLSPYRLGRIQLLGTYRGEEGWYVLTLPETAWAPVAFGQTVGYPKYVVDSILFEQTQTGWRGQAEDRGQAILSLEFAPDPSVETWFEWLTRPSCLTIARQLLPAFAYKTTFTLMPDKDRHGAERKTYVVRATIAASGIPSITETFGRARISVDPKAPWAGLFPKDAVAKGVLRRFSGDWNLRHRILDGDQGAP